MDIPSKKIKRFRYLCYGASLLIFIMLFGVPVPRIVDSHILWGAPLLPRTGQHGTFLSDSMGMIMMILMIAILYCLTILAITYYRNKVHRDFKRILEVNLDAKQYEDLIRANYHYIHQIQKRPSPIEKISSQISLAYACIESGKFDEAEALVQDDSMFMQQSKDSEWIVQNIYRWNLLMRLYSRETQKSTKDQFLGAYEELKRIGARTDLKPYAKGVYDKILPSVERMKKGMDSEWDELIAFYENEITKRSTLTNLQKIYYTYYLAWIYKRIGMEQKAKDCFETVAKNGNTLYITQEAFAFEGGNESQPAITQDALASTDRLNKMTEYDCFKDYKSYKIKNLICFTDKQREKRSALIDKCHLLSPEVSFFTPGNDLTVRQIFAISIILYVIAIYLLIFLFTIIRMNPNIALIVIFIVLLTIPLQKNAAIPLMHKYAMKRIRQIEEAITQFEMISFESGKPGDFDKVIQSFSINEIFWGDVKKREVIVEGTVTAEPKEGTAHERKWNRRYKVIHRKGVVRISDIEEMQMQ